ncbi:MAG: cupin domain-containing protein [Candidatus Kapabacteria bacterium]|jgi:mannose-6-phosphate isomerase-like protein (cupin superfamily)|nr:cupin domain-containing protein [Candidatus Kapabacteria bacterium]
MHKINIEEKFSLINKHWSPKIVGELNGQHVLLAKIKGEFVMHKHDDEDEMFLVIEGSFRMEMPGKTIELGKGEFLIIPKGQEHRPIAEKEALIMLFEPAGTINTGNVKHDYSIDSPERI